MRRARVPEGYSITTDFGKIVYRENHIHIGYNYPDKLNMLTTLTNNPPHPAGVIREDTRDTRIHAAAPCPVPPLMGLRGTRAAVVSYRALAPDGAGLPSGIEGCHSDVLQPTANHSLLTAN